MKKHWRLICTVFSAGAVILTLLLAAALFFTSDWFLHNIALAYVSRKLELELAADRVTYNWKENRLSVVQLRGGSENDPCFLMGEICFQPDFKEILKGHLGCSTFHFHRPQLALYHQPNGDWTLYPSGKHIYFENVPEIRLKNLSWDNGSFLVVSGRPGAGRIVEFTDFHGGSASFANTDPFLMTLKGHLQFGVRQEGALQSGDCEVRLNLLLDQEFELRRLAIKMAIKELYGHFGDEKFSHLNVDGDLQLRFPPKGGVALEHCRVESRERSEVRSLIDLSGETFPDGDGFRCEVREGRMMPEMTSLFCDALFDLDPGSCTVNFKGGAGWKKNQFLMLRGDLFVNRSGDLKWHDRPLKLPPHRLNLSADFNIDLRKRFAAIRHGTLLLEEAGRLLATAQLVNPGQFALDAAADERSCASFDYRLAALDLTRTAFFFPSLQNLIPAGSCDGSGQLNVGNRVNGLQLNGDFTVSALRWQFSNGVLPADRAEFRISIGLDRQATVTLPLFAASLRQDKQTLGTISYQEKTGAVPGELFFSAQLESDRLPQLVPEKSTAKSFLDNFDRTKAVMQLAGRRRKSQLAVISGRLTLTGQDQDHLTLDVDPFHLNIPAADPQNDVFFRTSGAISAERVRRFISRSPIYLEKGCLKWLARGRIARNWRNIQCRGRAGLNRTRIHLWRIVLPECTAEPRFDLSFQDLNELKINQFELLLRHPDGGKMLTFEGMPCQWRFAPEKFSGSGRLTYLNADILNAAFPDTFAAASVTGNVRGTLQNGIFDGGLDLLLSGGRTRRTQTELNGTLTFHIHQQEGELKIRPFRFSLSDQKKERWLELNGDFQRGKEMFLLNLEAPTLNVGRLLAILPAAKNTPSAATAAASPDVPAAPPSVPMLPNSRSGRIHLNCSQLVLSPDIRGALKGEFQLTPGAIRQSELSLRLNGAEAVSHLTAANVPEGIDIRHDFKLKSPVDIAPFSRLVTGRAETLSQGTMNVLTSQCALVDNGSWSSSLRTLNGSLQTQVSNLKLQPGLDHSLGVKILLYPVDIFSHVASVLPETFGEWRQKLMTSARFSDYMTAVAFQQGNVSLFAKQGKITVKTCDFSGNEQLVRHLTMEGSCGVCENAPLALRAHVSGAAGQLTIPITGTISQPKVDFSDIATASAGDFFRKVKALNLVGVVSAPPGKQDPLFVLDHLPAAGFWKSTGRFFRNCFGGTDTTQRIR